MIDFKKDWGSLVLFSILLLCSIGLVVVQVANITSPTKLELSLVSALQYICSIGFTWLLSLMVFENTYKEKQKKFAIGAFRRIKEIERNIQRTQEHIDQSLKDGDDLKSCLKVAQFSLVNAQDTVNSSISDWADIIEDELEISAQIEKLESADNSNGKDKAIDFAMSEQIANLSKKLPPELRNKNVKEPSKVEKVKEATISLGKSAIEEGYLRLRAFWEPRDAFMKDLSQLSVGSKVYVARGITNTRTGAILLYDEDGNSLAVVTNRCGQLHCGYDVFADALDEIFGRTLRPKMFGGQPVQAEVEEIEEFDPKSERQYLSVKVYKKIHGSVQAKYPELQSHNNSMQPTANASAALKR